MCSDAKPGAPPPSAIIDQGNRPAGAHQPARAWPFPCDLAARYVGPPDSIDPASRGADRSSTGVGYQFAFRYCVPSVYAGEPEDRLSIDFTYDRIELAVGDSVTATATVVNRMPDAAPMVILDLPIPAGFTIDREGLDRLVTAGTIAKFQMNPRSAVAYQLVEKCSCRPPWRPSGT